MLAKTVLSKMKQQGVWSSMASRTFDSDMKMTKHSWTMNIHYNAAKVREIEAEQEPTQATTTLASIGEQSLACQSNSCFGDHRLDMQKPDFTQHVTEDLKQKSKQEVLHVKLMEQIKMMYAMGDRSPPIAKQRSDSEDKVDPRRTKKKHQESSRSTTNQNELQDEDPEATKFAMSMTTRQGELVDQLKAFNTAMNGHVDNARMSFRHRQHPT